MTLVETFLSGGGGGGVFFYTHVQIAVTLSSCEKSKY
jgi:hypothetical protein